MSILFSEEILEIEEYGQGFSYHKIGLSRHVQAFEFDFHEGCVGGFGLLLDLRENRPAGLIATVSEGGVDRPERFPNRENFELDFPRRDSSLLKILKDEQLHDDSHTYINEENSLLVFNNLNIDLENFYFQNRNSAFPLNVKVLLYPQLPQESAVSCLQIQEAQSSWKCSGCKALVRALATAIFLAVLKVALPAAVIAAVAAFLGLASDLAEDFIKSLGGSSISEIAEALCKKAALCP